MNCLICGGPLDPYDNTADPTHAPWVCDVDHRGWFNAELTDTAISKWRPQFQDFGLDGTVEAAVQYEIQALITAQAQVASDPDEDGQ